MRAARITSKRVLTALLVLAVALMVVAFPTANVCAAPARELSLEEKIGQMLMVGFNGLEANDETLSLIHRYHVGGLYLQGKNVRSAYQVATLVSSLKAQNRGQALPLFLGVDQEGGRVNRLPVEMGRLPAARVVGASRNEALYLQAGDLLANQLEACGLNMDFAPVADLDDGPSGTAIGDRSFGAEAASASSATSQVMVGIRMNNIIPVVKHFPGHGNTRTDSHVQLPVVRKNLAQLEATDLMPFAAAIECGAQAIMVGHVLVPELDAESPASLSEPIVTRLLRGEMGFEGVIMTDDLAMRPVRDRHRIGDAAVAAVLAGVDVVMISGGFKEQVEAALALQDAVLSGVIPLARIDESVRRITELKEAFYLDDSDPESPDITALKERVTEFAAKVRQAGALEIVVVP